MPTVTVYSQNGTEQGSLELSEKVYDEQERSALVHQVVVGYLANRRQGTAATKGRSDVRGGGAKPWRQKGTGRARQGTTRSPIWRGGGAVHGPQPHSHRKRLSQSMRQTALRSCLSDVVRREMVKVVDGIQLAEPKTKEVVKILKDLGVAGKVLLVIGSEPSEDLLRAARNLPMVNIRRAEQLTSLDVVAADWLVMPKDVAIWLQSRLGGE